MISADPQGDARPGRDRRNPRTGQRAYARSAPPAPRWRGRNYSPAAVTVKFKPDQDLTVSSTAILAGAGHDAGTVTHEGLIGAPDPDVVTAATAAAEAIRISRPRRVTRA